MVVIRVGEGHSPSGKIIDRDTKWYQSEHIYDAIQYHLKTGKKMYISKNNGKYTEFNPDKTTISELFDYEG